MTTKTKSKPLPSAIKANNTREEEHQKDPRGTFDKPYPMVRLDQADIDLINRWRLEVQTLLEEPSECFFFNGCAYEWQDQALEGDAYPARDVVNADPLRVGEELPLDVVWQYTSAYVDYWTPIYQDFEPITLAICLDGITPMDLLLSPTTTTQ